MVKGVMAADARSVLEGKAFEWTPARDRVVSAMRGAQVPLRDIAQVLGCTENTIRKRFPRTKFVGIKKNKRERVLSERERDIACSMAAYGVPKTVIARALGLSTQVLNRLAGEAMEVATALTTHRVAGFLFKEAQKGNVQAQIYWLKARGGNAWKETQHVQIEGKMGVLVVPGAVSPESWISSEVARGEAAGAKGGVAEAHVGERLMSQVEAQRGEGAALPWNASKGDDVIELQGDMVEVTDVELEGFGGPHVPRTPIAVDAVDTVSVECDLGLADGDASSDAGLVAMGLTADELDMFE